MEYINQPTSSFSSAKAPMFVRDCIRCYTTDYTVVEYKYRAYSGSMCGRERLGERLERLHASPRHQYEIDAEHCCTEEHQVQSAE